MRLRRLYQEKLEQLEQEGIQQGIPQGIQQGIRLIVENVVKARFGELDAELSALIDSMLTLPPEELAPLLLQLSREELLERFGG
ncbi:hypothetical protein ACE1B6_18525 [Aerosakkonemataceae cyanobacterium BLCC-F154]|uniref:DUF4351 domain-containing protein n=1 Tax=Floridaenema fluviatile BLCC-F154 TaxID=3153640 RepID=A0ABV4YEI5_9CYAN